MLSQKKYENMTASDAISQHKKFEIVIEVVVVDPTI